MTRLGTSNFFRYQVMPVMGATLALAMVLPAHADDSGSTPSVTVGGGVAVGPLYEGSSRYAAFPSVKLKAVLPTENWGKFTAAFPDGLRWDLPGLSPFGVALLIGYDQGRKERIQTLGGRDDHLRGMGNLDSTALVGAEAYWVLPAGRLFVRGLQSSQSRDYGGESLGRTAYLEAGVATAYPLSSTLTLDSTLYGTWSNENDMMARFGVTAQQAARTRFDEYHPGGGMRDVTLKLGLTWQWQPQLAIEGGIKTYALVSDARNSPLTDEKVGAGAYLNALYRF
ncbi:MipA/OmpV family protein [Pseudomonas gingeri]|uniref:MipA/OmpV family protein n=1 Tax=Pseudomonas gingeri TaxID=117681 RepID=A0A7Y7YET9_9PSED|nr:MipA/OmpV family protein [Pseudomonas gingeri]NWB25815.1 MipA/OmpV family protein [Pseudomonas gingeri]NWC34589.1 MipA/OmpV family protein [Pseudomonas gingeri]NWD08380.1 MipA/OmpV family protein [Pseudomonas gingeri]NWD47791.1 MipA/OmpV family protein [Pseudomonas gingeri]NWE26228.1 MipA/OmpV family protein [Pseudomonas gingeri]